MRCAFGLFEYPSQLLPKIANVKSFMSPQEKDRSTLPKVLKGENGIEDPLHACSIREHPHSPGASSHLPCKTSLILIPHLAMSSSMRRFLGFPVLKIISSTSSLSTISQLFGFGALRIFLTIGVSKGL